VLLIDKIAAGIVWINVEKTPRRHACGGIAGASAGAGGAAASRLKSEKEFWQRDKVSESLIRLPAGEAISKHFQQV
jgi:hypothetical protein